jgi:hypothetical protein
VIVEDEDGFVHGLFTYGEISFDYDEVGLQKHFSVSPKHQIPHIIFGVQNRVSYKSRQL